MVSGKANMGCGVADYTERLMHALRSRGAEVSLLTQAGWSLRRVGEIARVVAQAQPDVVHIQYPTAIFGKGLAPQALALWVKLRWPTVVTLHEFSQVHPLRRLSTYPFASVQHLIFTNSFERESFARRFPWVAHKSSVVALGSNIPYLGRSEHANQKQGIYFGLIRENKGLEAFIELARLCYANQQPYEFIIMGSMQIGSEGYFQRIRQAVSDLPNLTLEVGLSTQEVAQRLSNSGFAYLAFPDGASERRTSLLAALGNGLPTLTTKGLHTPESLVSAVEFVGSPAEALQVLERWREQPEARETLQARAVEYAQRFDWGHIAQAHLDIYGRL